MSESQKPRLVLADKQQRVTFYEGDSLRLLAELPEESVDCVGTDPPYNLSNDGITCIAGKMVKVNKGEWGQEPRRRALTMSSIANGFGLVEEF